MTYFGEREFGEQPLINETISAEAWGGLKALVYARVEDGSLGAGYPSACEDGQGPKGTNEEMLRLAIHGEISDLPYWPWLTPTDEPPQTVTVLELMEFCWRHVGHPTQVGYHQYWKHYHLKFDSELGRTKFVEGVNLVLRRNGLAYELTHDGHIVRLGPPVLREELTSAHFITGDSELDRILESARRKFLSPREEIRREALLELWDAWERLKTTGDGPNKKDQITSLLDGAAGPSYPQFRARLETDARELTEIGNSHQIRHTEVTQEKVESSDHIDYLFHRLFSMIQLILGSKGT